MIDVRELRIGNLFWENYGGHKIVTAINCNKVGDAPNTVSARAINNTVSGSFDCNAIYPIELTEDILIKCGFEFHSEENRAGIKIKYLYRIGDWYGHLENWYYNGESEYNMNVGDHRYVTIKYLHQLQNLYYALTNEELEINL